jgi:NADH dehydrogenase [ubiquinone] 1 alpha subcomplex assembly factor 7
MTNLREYLQDLILMEGPIPIAQYMEACLTHPEFGYYVTTDPLGPEGDFITAPEISQMFGEMVGLWVVDCWQKMGRPHPVQLVELGPGRGTLMADMIRTLKISPGLKAAAQIHLVEASPVLAASQAKNLEAVWHPDLSSVPGGPFILIANEFFDTLPIHQFQKTDNDWREIVVGMRETSFATELATPSETLDRLSDTLRDNALPGQFAEVAPAVLDLCQMVGGRIDTEGGAGLIIDYGYAEEGYGETLQAVKNHQFSGIFDDPGRADLTAHVNFAALRRSLSAAGAAVWGPTTQAEFLSRMGIAKRAERLSETASPKQKKDISAALHRLTSAREMGQLFRVLAATQLGMDPPFGFDRGNDA